MKKTKLKKSLTVAEAVAEGLSQAGGNDVYLDLLEARAETLGDLAGTTKGGFAWTM